jgi:hypothetical protein
MGVGKIFSSTENLIYGTFCEKLIFNMTSNKFNVTPNKIIRKKIIKGKILYVRKWGWGKFFRPPRISYMVLFAKSSFLIGRLIKLIGSLTNLFEFFLSEKKNFMWCENGGGENFFVHRESHIWYF